MAAYTNTQQGQVNGRLEGGGKLRELQEDASNAEMVACRQMHPR